MSGQASVTMAPARRPRRGLAWITACLLGVLGGQETWSAPAARPPSATPPAKRPATPPAKRPATSPPRQKISPRQRARQLVVAGARQLRRGDYVLALKRFKEAFAIYPSPKILFNMAQTYMELGRLVDALDAYERFLRRARPAATNALAKVARRRVIEIKGKVATVLVAVNVPGAVIHLGGKEVGVSPMDLPRRIMPGRYLVMASKMGYVSASLKCEAKPGHRAMVRLELKKPRPKVVVRRIEYRRIKLPRKGLAVFWTGVGLTAALAIGSVVMGGMSLYEQSVLEDVSRAVERRLVASERGSRYSWVTDGLLIAAGAGALFSTVWGVVVVLRSGGTKRVRVPARPAVSVLPAGPGVTLKIRF